MLALVQCDVCVSAVPFDQFQVFLCGHGLCVECIPSFFRHCRVCQQCRKRVHISDLHPIFLTLEKPSKTIVPDAINNLGRMDSGSSAVSVERIGKKISEAAGSVEEDPNMTITLQSAINDFKERIIPLFNEVEEQRREIATLQEKLLNSEKKLNCMQKIERNNKKETIKLQENLQNSEKHRNEALSAAEKATNEVLRLRLYDADQKSMISELTLDKKRLIDKLDQYQKNAYRDKDKLTELNEQVSYLSSKAASLKTELEKKTAALQQSSCYDSQYSDSFEPLQSGSSQLATDGFRTPAKRLFSAPEEQNSSPVQIFEGMPPPGFASDWQIIRRPRSGVLTKVNIGNLNVRPVTSFPINLDKRGKPTSAVQLGPKNTKRVRI